MELAKIDVRIHLSFDNSVYPQNQTSDTMTTQLSAIYRRDRNEGEWEREDRSWTMLRKDEEAVYTSKHNSLQNKNFFKWILGQ